MDVKNKDMSFGIRKKLPYTEFLNIQIGKMKSSGLLDIIFGKDSNSITCADEDIHNQENEFVEIRFEKAYMLTTFSQGVGCGKIKSC